MLRDRHTRSSEIKLWADIIIMTLDLFLTPDLILKKCYFPLIAEIQE